MADEEPSREETPGAQTLRRGLAILKLLARYQPTGLRISDIGRKTGLNKATAVRLTRTLVEERFVTQDPGNRYYRLGPESFAVGLAAEPAYALQRLAAPVLRTLALETGEHFFGEDSENPKFIWTTGAWLVADYLANAAPADVRRMEQAIERWLIRWHALPFTTHSELMSADLFRAGLSYSQELDRRFGRMTTAAKMTDVPGHTRSIVPLLAEAGVRFLHLGVNEASPVPDVPEVFRWRSRTG